MKLLVASRNAHKVRELGRLLAPHAVAALPGDVVLPPETGTTYAENAEAKAAVAAAATGGPTIADDSGIEAAALGGAPGARSARFAGERASDAENLAKLLREVGARVDRSVAYVCALAYANGDRRHTVIARCDGRLAPVPRGDGGFGYDPAFVPSEVGDGRTMAELSAEEKDRVSHRGRAARLLLEWLEDEAIA